MSDASMQEKGKISVLQLAFLVVTIVISTADILLPSFVAREAKQDSWIAVIIATLSSVILINIILFLAARYPDKTLIQYACDILGSPLGKAVGISYILFFLITSSGVLSQIQELFVISFNPAAPVIVFGLVILLTAAYAVSKGLEVIARINQLLLPVGILILFFIAVINIKNMDFKNFLPILHKGFYPSFKGAFLVQAWMLESVVVLHFWPYVSRKRKARKSITLALLALGISLETGVLTIAVFGPLTEKFVFPALEYVRSASLGPHMENLDITIMMVWIGGIFIKITVFYYLIVLGIAQSFNFNSYKFLIAPVGILLITLTMTIAKPMPRLLHYLHYAKPFQSLIMGFVVPFLLLVISIIRQRFGKTAISKNKRQN